MLKIEKKDNWNTSKLHFTPQKKTWLLQSILILLPDCYSQTHQDSFPQL